MANEIQGKPEELGHGELDVEVIARAVVEHIADDQLSAESLHNMLFVQLLPPSTFPIH